MTTWQFSPPALSQTVGDWSAGYAGLMFLMWWVMMIAMMTPGASPMILLYASAYHFEQHQGKLPAGVAPTFAFALGYLLAWAAFSLVATGMQWSFERAGLLHQMTMWSINPLFTATLLIGAGLYQLTPVKRACLDSCRSLARYLAERFRPGPTGALRLGWKHGLYCVGCCWFLMALLFAGGRHESRVDRRAGCLSADRKGRSAGASDRPRDSGAVGGLRVVGNGAWVTGWYGSWLCKNGR